MKRRHPATITVDNGPEFRGKARSLRSRRTGVELRYIQPGKPIQYALVESFNGKFRDAYLIVHWFVDPTGPRRNLQAWQRVFNETRPHRSLNELSPKQFKALWAQRISKIR